MTRHSEPPFWLVWNEDGDAPRVKHMDPDSAEREATRLASLHPGKSFVVLAPIFRATKRTVDVERFAPDAYVPF